MITILKIILFFILLSYILRLLSPLILTFVFKRFQNKIKKDFEKMNNSNSYKKSEKPKSNPKEKVGEYVDFEEID
ncbi:MAG: DUF4834 domain-containing protein [Flavobacteriaceae bacterium]|nr:DUF4834 domain-containing protein [Flavobacteriaceae bacterium]|tara:strand:+ start:460 stop:684 length:225 start_codon:yes stop_codon:yes gene_type:complete